MNEDELYQRLKDIDENENKLKTERDFIGLIKVFDESLEVYDSIDNFSRRIPQKAYCLARLGRNDEAQSILERVREFAFFEDEDELFRKVTLVSLFISTDVSDFGLMQINTIKSWLKDPKASKQVTEIIFDYKDIVGNIEPFEPRNEVKQTFFSDELQNCVFAAMGRNDEDMIYYNRETNDVQQHVQGYLSSHMAEDSSYENRKLADRIMSSDASDPIVEGVHFLIRRLLLVDYLEEFSVLSSSYDALLDFVSEFEQHISNEYGDMINSIDELVFNNSIETILLQQLDKWFQSNEFDLDTLKDILSQTRKNVALDYLCDINE